MPALTPALLEDLKRKTGLTQEFRVQRWKIALVQESEDLLKIILPWRQRAMLGGKIVTGFVGYILLADLPAGQRTSLNLASLPSLTLAHIANFPSLVSHSATDDITVTAQFGAEIVRLLNALPNTKNEASDLLGVGFSNDSAVTRSVALVGCMRARMSS